MGFLDKFRKKDAFGPDKDSFADPLADDPMRTSFSETNQFGRQDSMNDPMSSSFVPNPSFQTGQYPTQSAPFPGQAPQLYPNQHPNQQPAQPQGQQQYYDDQPSRDVELILAKLDAIKAELDALHQRVKKLEAIADSQTKAQAGQSQHRYSW